MRGPSFTAAVVVALLGSLLGGMVTACGSAGKAGAAGPGGRGTIGVTSSAFNAGGAIPVKYSCNGDNVSPPLAWTNVPPATRELALVVDDPDASSGVFYHWVIAGLAPTTTGLAEGQHPSTAVEAMGSSGQPGYTGMCPPDKQRHHYRFTVYALRSPSGVTAGMAPIEAKNRIVAVELAQGQLVGTFGP